MGFVNWIYVEAKAFELSMVGGGFCCLLGRME